MEKRLIMAIVLSFLVLVLYQAIFLKNKPQPEAQPPVSGPVEKTPIEAQVKENK